LFGLAAGARSVVAQDEGAKQLKEILSGVQFSFVSLGEGFFELTGENRWGAEQTLIGFREAFEALGLEVVLHDSPPIDPNAAYRAAFGTGGSLCDWVVVLPGIKLNPEGTDIVGLRFTVMSCDEVAIVRTADKPKVSGYKTFGGRRRRDDFHERIALEVEKLLPGSREYDISNRRELAGDELFPFDTYDKAAAYLDQNLRHRPEGIYERVLGVDSRSAKYLLAVIADPTDSHKLNAIYLSGASNVDDWKQGELKARLYGAVSDSAFSVTWYMADKSPKDSVSATLESDGTLTFDFGGDNPAKYVRVYPAIPERQSPDSGLSEN
jgi:hypothetical protein